MEFVSPFVPRLAENAAVVSQYLRTKVPSSKWQRTMAPPSASAALASVQELMDCLPPEAQADAKLSAVFVRLHQLIPTHFAEFARHLLSDLWTPDSPLSSSSPAPSGAIPPLDELDSRVTTPDTPLPRQERPSRRERPPRRTEPPPGARLAAARSRDWSWLREHGATEQLRQFAAQRIRWEADQEQVFARLRSRGLAEGTYGWEDALCDIQRAEYFGAGVRHRP